MAKRDRTRRRTRPPKAKPEGDLLAIQVKTYVTSRVADMLRERRGDVPEAAYLRRLLYNDLGLDSEGKRHGS